MSTKMNRYDLSLWDVRKRSLYVEKREASKLHGLKHGLIEGIAMKLCYPEQAFLRDTLGKAHSTRGASFLMWF
jgi:hypothetical protein